MQSFFHSDSILTCDEQKRVGGFGCWVRILLRCRRDAAVIYLVLVPSSLLVLSAHRFALFQISSHLFNEQLIINTLSLRRQRNSPGIIDVPSLSYRLSLSAIERRFCEGERGCVRDDELSEVLHAWIMTSNSNAASSPTSSSSPPSTPDLLYLTSPDFFSIFVVLDLFT